MQQNNWKRLDDEVYKVIERLRVTREKSGIPVSRSLLQSISTYNSADDDQFDLGGLK